MACAAACSVSLAAPPSAASTSSSLLSSSSRVRFHVFLAAPSVRPSSQRFRGVVAMATSPIKPGEVVGKVKQLADDLVDRVKQSIGNAQEVCDGNETSEECVVAWDEVEELSAAAADRRQKSAPSGYKDPLDQYCEDNPESDECRVYED